MNNRLPFREAHTSYAPYEQGQTDIDRNDLIATM